MKTKVKKWGNSYAIRLPKSITDELMILEDSPMTVEKEGDKIILKKLSKEEELEELLSQITPENKHEEVDWGPPRGNEFW